MGRNNKRRRAAKAKARRGSKQANEQRNNRQGTGAFFAGEHHSPAAAEPIASVPRPATVREQVRDLVYLTLMEAESRPVVAERARAQVLRLASESPAGGRAVGQHLSALLREQLGLAWRRGWQPADLHRVVARDLSGGRRGSGSEQAVLADAMAAELAGYAANTVHSRWWAQLAELEGRMWWPADSDHLSARASAEGWERICAAALGVLGLLGTLPEIGMLGPLPGKADPAARDAAERASQVDERILRRVRALLAKAESTTYEPEAETFTAGAQALMARHSIDAAMLDAARNEDERARSGPGAIRIGTDRPYEQAKALLLDRVAEANRCRTVWSQRLGFSTVLGFPPDLRAVETLFTSLLLQSTAAMQREGSRQTAWGQSRTRSFRQSFLMAYATRIGERLAEVARAEEGRASGGEDPDAGRGDRPMGARAEVLPVLAARSREVEDATAAMFPELVERRAGRVSDSEGWVRGRAAAEQASLTGRHALPVGS